MIINANTGNLIIIVYLYYLPRLFWSIVSRGFLDFSLLSLAFESTLLSLPCRWDPGAALRLLLHWVIRSGWKKDFTSCV